jgi:hypothetical protein
MLSLSNVKFKEGIDAKEIELLTPLAWALFQIFVLEATISGEQITVTSIREVVAGRVSDTHKEGRAVDISVIGWKDPKGFCNDFNKKYERLGAMSKSTGKRTPCVYHSISGDSGWHIHLQAAK